MKIKLIKKRFDCYSDWLGYMFLTQCKNVEYPDQVERERKKLRITKPEVKMIFRDAYKRFQGG